MYHSVTTADAVCPSAARTNHRSTLKRDISGSKTSFSTIYYIRKHTETDSDMSQIALVADLSQASVFQQVDTKRAVANTQFAIASSQSAVADFTSESHQHSESDSCSFNPDEIQEPIINVLSESEEILAYKQAQKRYPDAQNIYKGFEASLELSAQPLSSIAEDTPRSQAPPISGSTDSSVPQVPSSYTTPHKSAVQSEPLSTLLSGSEQLVFSSLQRIPDPVDSDSDSSPNYVRPSVENNTVSNAGNLDNIVAEAEYIKMQQILSPEEVSTQINNEEAALSSIEDHVSRLFYDPYDEDDNDTNSDNSGDELRVNEIEAQSAGRGEFRGGLQGWTYDNPIKEFSIGVDDVDSFLEERYLDEVQSVFRRVLSETTRVKLSDDLREFQLTPLQAFRLFLPTSLLQKVADKVNRVLIGRGLPVTSVQELEGVIILHCLCAAYNEPVKTINADPDCFLSFPLKPRRYHELWSAMSCTVGKRQRADYERNASWSFLSNESNAFVMQIESDVASVNRRLCYLPGSTILSLDDDLLRLSSRDVLTLTALSQTNNPKKGLGVINNALCSALTSLLIVAHHSRPGESLVDIWSHIIELLQGVPTTGALKQMPNAIFASDRGYNGRGIMELLNERLGAMSLGTHKRSLDYPFIFGDGRINKRHKGRRISEKGCRSAYAAVKKCKKGQDIEACLYREAYSGRIAAYYHNNRRLFGSEKFTLVPRRAFRGHRDASALEELQVVHDVCEPTTVRGISTGDLSSRVISLSETRKCVNEGLSRVDRLTYLQAEDPTWFLLRAFTFTSRTAHGFTSVVFHDYERNIIGLSHALRGKRLSIRGNQLSDNEATVASVLKESHDAIADVIGIQRGSVASDGQGNVEACAVKIKGLANSEMDGLTKNAIHTSNYNAAARQFMFLKAVACGATAEVSGRPQSEQSTTTPRFKPEHPRTARRYHARSGLKLAPYVLANVDYEAPGSDQGHERRDR